MNAPIAIASVGILSLVASLAMYVYRTGDKTALTRTWATRDELTRTEYIFNRGGFALVVVGIAVLAALRIYG